MAAGIATLEVYKEQAIFENAAALEPYFEQLLHSLKGLPHVVDIRNIGLMGAVEMTPIAGFPVARSMVIIPRYRSLPLWCYIDDDDDDSPDCLTSIITSSSHHIGHL